MKSQLRGIFLTADQPDITADFYQHVAGLSLESVGDPASYRYWRSDEIGVQFSIHAAERFAEYARPICRSSNVTHLYFKIRDQSDFLRHLEELKIVPYSIDDVVVTVIDPDGRHVMFGTA